MRSCPCRSAKTVLPTSSSLPAALATALILDGHTLSQRNLEDVAPPKKINFPPIQNGLDYLKSTVEHLRERPTARDLKYAVLHLQAAVEVLLKVRLIREHWTLVFSKPNQASQAAFATGDFTSIGLDDTMARLKGIVGVSLKTQAEQCGVPMVSSEDSGIVCSSCWNYVINSD